VARYGSSITGAPSHQVHPEFKSPPSVGLCDSDSDVDMAVLLPSLPAVAFTGSSEQALAIYQCMAGWEAIEALEVIPKARGTLLRRLNPRPATLPVALELKEWSA
jgi:hypothetical protein